MSTIVIEGGSNKNIELLISLAKQLGVKVKRLTASEKEDMGLGILMNNVKTGIQVSEKTILSKLK